MTRLHKYAGITCIFMLLNKNIFNSDHSLRYNLIGNQNQKR